jgi:GMP synthase (glutamine-hydrolysing)
MNLRLLIVDAYAPAGRRALEASGATRAGRLYERALREVSGAVEVEVVEAGEGAADIGSLEPGGFDGVVWTGSNLTVHEPDEMVRRQLRLARAAFAGGVPQFGSCWAIQLAAVAAGGVCARNPRGREFGIARAITVTESGAGHPLLRGRPPAFEAFASHEDMVAAPPPGALVLAGNEFCAVQALAVRHDRGTFWATQYHPEYDFHEVARLAVLRREQLIRERRFAGEEEAADFVADFETLHEGADDGEHRRRQQASAEVADPHRRRLEIANWLAALRGGALRS